MNRILKLGFIGTLIFFQCVQSLKAEDEPLAKIKVDGTGFFKNRILMQQLETIFYEERTFYGPADIEDAALILISDVQSDGYLEARTIGMITDATGNTSSVEWDKQLDVFLPKETQGLSVEFEIILGPRFYYHSLTTNETPVLAHEEIEAFFYSEPYLFGGEESKIFTPSLFNSGAQNLQSHLKQLGYRDANVFPEIVNLDTSTGASDLKLTINTGPLYTLKEVHVSSSPPQVYSNDHAEYLGEPYNTFLRQDIMQEIRNAYYALGYAKMNFEYEEIKTPLSSDAVEIGLNISITPGPQIKISNIEFEGAESIRRSLLEEQLTLKEGDFFDPGNLNRSRMNLSRLGLFQKVEYELEETGDNEESLTFKLRDRTTWELDSVLGWGSYERLRLGVSAEKLNAFGLGHRIKFKSSVSSKSLLGEIRYLIPNFLDTEFPFSTKLFFLEREELSFDREEYGVTFGTSKYLQRLDLTMDAVYIFQALNARINDQGSAASAADNLRSGSVGVRFSRDKRDNPLNPQSGYRLFGDVEWGSEVLGGEVDYQLAEFGLSYHNEIKRGLIWHGAFTHAVVGSFFESQSQVPTNKLLYPGGENSVRGYQRGGAAPRDINGGFIGAQSFLILNLELEQRLTDTISIVGFFDGLGMAANIGDYPFDEYLSSIGLGIRFRTFMGPIRLEYGHNLNQRPEDPDGTLHLTIGYPF